MYDIEIIPTNATKKSSLRTDTFSTLPAIEISEEVEAEDNVPLTQQGSEKGGDQAWSFYSATLNLGGVSKPNRAVNDRSDAPYRSLW